VLDHRGEALEIRGDAMLAGFARTSDAVSAALAFQRLQREYLASLEDEIRPQVRVGIAMGEVVIADSTVTGAGVVLAQRIEQLADGGGVCITSAIYEALPRRLPFDFEDLGEQTLKGFDETVRVFRVDLSSGGEISVPLPDAAPDGRSRTWRPGVVLALLVALLGGGAFFVLRDQAPPQTGVNAPANTVTQERLIAVLPFTNMSSDAEQEYFADGMTEDLITDISRISGLEVIARHSTFAYKGLNPDVRDVGRELGASHVIEGSVRKAGNTVRITIQLIDATDGKHVWAERYDRELSDVFAIQDEVIGEIVTALSVRLTREEEERVARHPTENLDAYDLFMRGRQQESYFNRESFVAAQRYYEQVIEADPDYAEAWARLAQIHTMNGQFGWVEDIEAADRRALELVEEGLRLDPDIPFVHYSHARILARDSIAQHDRAIEALASAIELDPNYADAYAYLGQMYILTGQAEKTLEPIAKAMRINPSYPFWYHYTYGFAQFFMGNYDDAAENIAKAVDRNPNVLFLRTSYAAALAMAGRQDDAEWQIEEMRGLGFNKTLDEFMGETPVHDPQYRVLYREGLVKAGMR
jgi:adenylate cyclase